MTLEEGSRNWRNNYEAQLQFMVSQLQSIETKQKVIRNIADYLQVEPSVVRGSRAVRAFESSVDELTKEHLKELIRRGTGEDTFEEAMQELSGKWRSNYLGAFEGEPP